MARKIVGDTKEGLVANRRCYLVARPRGLDHAYYGVVVAVLEGVRLDTMLEDEVLVRLPKKSRREHSPNCAATGQRIGTTTSW